MLQESADDRAHANAITETRDARAQSAHATDDKVDLDAGLRCSVERVDRLEVNKRVDLGDDARSTPGLCVLGFTCYEPEEIRREGDRCDHQRAVRLGARIP